MTPPAIAPASEWWWDIFGDGVDAGDVLLAPLGVLDEVGFGDGLEAACLNHPSRTGSSQVLGYWPFCSMSLFTMSGVT